LKQINIIGRVPSAEHEQQITMVEDAIAEQHRQSINGKVATAKKQW
jgi:hypothetical protein